MANLEKIERLNKANEFVQTVASHGYQFFQYNNNGTPQFAYFSLNENGHLIWHTENRDAKIYIRKGEWRHFGHGMTLQSFVERLADYIRQGKRISDNYFSNWGFGKSLPLIITKGRESHIIKD